MKVAAMLAVAAYGVTAADPQAYDYIVIGSGAGGSPVASKLAQAGKSVLLLEAGPDDSWKGRAAGRTRQDKGPRADPLLPNNTYLSVLSPCPPAPPPFNRARCEPLPLSFLPSS